MKITDEEIRDGEMVCRYCKKIMTKGESNIAEGENEDEEEDSVLAISSTWACLDCGVLVKELILGEGLEIEEQEVIKGIVKLD
jgi:hypothetical protein